MKSFLLALQFLTRLPITVQGDVDERDMAQSVVFFPLIGALIGLGLYGVNHILSPAADRIPLGWLLLASQFLLTGGLHYDAFADVADAWFVNGDRTRRLEIMRDSRIGSLGASGLLIHLALKAHLLGAIGGAQPWVWVHLGMGAKMAMVAAIYFYPYARKQGTGGLFSAFDRYQLLTATCMSLLPLLFAPRQLWLAYACGLLVVAVVARRLARLLGGLTGDCYGALQEVFQVVFLLAWQLIS